MRKVPKLRFKEFSDEWEEKKLGEIGNKITSKNNSEKIKIVLTNSAEKGIVKQEDFFDKEITNEKNINNYYIVSKNDFVYNPRISKQAPYGPINKSNIDIGIVSPLYLVFNIKNENVNFLEKYFKSSYWYSYMYNIGNSGARFDRMNIGINDFFNMPINIPSLKEQEKIANFLTNIDKKISLTEENLELFREYKKGIMQKIFSQELKFKNSEGNDYPKWKDGKIKDFGYFYYGKSAPKHSVVELGGTPCVRYGELYSTYNEYIKEVKSYNNIPINELKLSKGGEVLVPRVREDPLDFANCSYLPLENIAIGEMISVYNTEENGLFITYYFNATMKKEFAKYVEGASVSNLYFTYLENIKISTPSSLEEQQKIADFLSSIDSKIESIEKELEGLKEFKKGLLQQMFV